MSKIILISGQQGAGKTTLAERLWDHFWDEKAKKGAVRLKFADPLYAMQEAINDIMRDHKVSMPEKDGTLLQLLGTEWGRKVKGDDIWVKILKRQVERYELQGAGLFIIDDCRFKNEFDAFPDALRIRLKASEEVRKTRTHSWRENTGHASEVNLDDIESQFELVIDTGTSTKDETFKKVIDLFNLKFSEQI